MGDQEIWTVLALVYIVPFFVWQYLAVERLDIRKNLYPGRNLENAQKRSFLDGSSIVWSTGLLAGFVAWRFEWHPIPTAILIGLTLLALTIYYRSKLNRPIISTTAERLLIAFSATWAMLIAAIQLIFSRHIRLEDGDLVLLAILPPIIGFFATVLFSWAKIEK